MRGDLPPAAFRLLNALPVRTHERAPYVRPDPLWKREPKPKKRVETGKGRGGNNRRPFLVDGKLYRTRQSCRAHLQVGNAKIKYWFSIGRAVYA